MIKSKRKYVTYLIVGLVCFSLGILAGNKIIRPNTLFNKYIFMEYGDSFMTLDIKDFKGDRFDGSNENNKYKFVFYVD